MKTTVKETKNVTKEVKQEFNLKEAFVLWKRKSGKGNDYLSGYTSDSEGNKTYLNGFFNTNKKNPKEPDIRVVTSVNEGEESIEVASLWENVSENKGTRYLTGSTNEKEKLVGFYAKEQLEGRPYIRVHYKEIQDKDLPF